MNIYVTAIIEPLPGKMDEVGDILAAVVEPVRAEPGCLRYDLHEDPDLGRYLFYEIWEDTAALESHGNTPHLMAMREGLDGKVAGPADVNVWQAVNTAA